VPIEGPSPIRDERRDRGLDGGETIETSWRALRRRRPRVESGSMVRVTWQTLKWLVYGRIRMGTRNVRLDEDVYERVAAHKRDDETFSEAVDRLLRDVSLLDLVDDGDHDPDRAAARKDAPDRTAKADAIAAEDLAE
jgi:hypothetical protein